MKVLHLLVAGHVGGIETLMKHYAACSVHENHFLFLWEGGQLAREIRDHGAPVNVLDMKRDGPGKTLGILERYCTENRVDTVVTHHSAPFLKLALLWLKLRHPDIRALAYAHANAFDICEGSRKRGLGLRKRIHRAGFRGADGVIAISQSVKRSLTDYLGVPPDRITVIPNGIPIPAASARRSGSVKLIYVGRLIPEKGVKNTLHALAKLPADLDYSFDIVGRGPDEESLRRLSLCLGLEARVCFLGTRLDVPELLARAHIFVHMPQWEEGFGMAVLEAMAAGCLCVCAGTGAMPELISSGTDGYLTEKDDPESLARLLEALIRREQAGDNEEMRHLARKRAEYFTVERFSAALDGMTEGRGSGTE